MRLTESVPVTKELTNCQCHFNGPDIMSNFMSYGVTAGNLQYIFKVCMADNTVTPLVHNHITRGSARVAMYYKLHGLLLTDIRGLFH